MGASRSECYKEMDQCVRMHTCSTGDDDRAADGIQALVSRGPASHSNHFLIATASGCRNKTARRPPVSPAVCHKDTGVQTQGIADTDVLQLEVHSCMGLYS